MKMSSDAMNYIDTFTDLLRQAMYLISQMKHEDYILALKQWRIADTMVQSLASQFDILGTSYAEGANTYMQEDDNDSVDSAKIREQIDLMVDDLPDVDNEKGSSWTIFNDTFLMFSDDELETIFRKAFVRSKTKTNDEKHHESSTEYCSNQVCDKLQDENIIQNSSNLKTQPSSLMMGSPNTTTCSSDTNSSYTPDQPVLSPPRDKTNQYATSRVLVQAQDMKSSLIKEHSVLTSLLEQKTDLNHNFTNNTTPFITNGSDLSFHQVNTSKRSQLFETSINSTNNTCSNNIHNNFELLDSESNVKHMVTSSNNNDDSNNNDNNNFKIEIVMELDKAVTNSVNSDSKYKIKIGPENFKNMFTNEFPRVQASHMENNRTVFIESVTTRETICSSYQVKGNNNKYCQENEMNKTKIDLLEHSKGPDKTKHEIKKVKPRLELNSQCKKKNIKTNLVDNNSAPFKSNNDDLIEIEDAVKFTSAIPSKQYSYKHRKDIYQCNDYGQDRQIREESYKKEDEFKKFKDKYERKMKNKRKEKSENNYSTKETYVQLNTNSNFKKNTLQSHYGDEKVGEDILINTPPVFPSEKESNSNEGFIPDSYNQNEKFQEFQLNEEKCEQNEQHTVKMCQTTNEEEDDDVIVLEEKKRTVENMKNEQMMEHDNNIKCDNILAYNTLASNNFFLISNQDSKDKQNIKYFILNNNSIFKPNYEANKIETSASETSMDKQNINAQSNLFLLNNDKNGNFFILNNKDVMKQSTSFMMNNNGALYNPCETQYYIINDTNTAVEELNKPSAFITEVKNQSTPDSYESAQDKTLKSLLEANNMSEVMNTSVDTITLDPCDSQDQTKSSNNNLIKKSTENYDPQLNSGKTIDSNDDADVLDTTDDPKPGNKDLIQNKENILVHNNNLSDEHFKFDSNDSGVQIRLEDGVFALNEKISNELKMGGKCTDIPQIYFINDLGSPLSLANEFCLDPSTKETQSTMDIVTSQIEFLHYEDVESKSKTQDNGKTTNNVAFITPPLLKTTLHNNDNSLSNDVILNYKETEKSSDLKPKPLPAKNTKLTSVKQSSSSFLKHLKNKLDKQKHVSKNQLLNKTPTNYLHKHAPPPKKSKPEEDENILITNDPIENASKILALCLKKESEANKVVTCSCSICSMVFCDEDVLQKHVEEHKKLGKLTCTVCKKALTNVKSLKVHSRVHTGERPFKCSICGKTFSQRGVLSSHLAVHAGVKPHVCKQCGRAFTQKSQLRLHEMRHGNIRHFACTMCPSKFTTKSDLQRHQRSHDGQKPFQCDYCSKTFTRQIILREHMNRHKNEQPYSCSQCNQSFFDGFSLSKHVKLVHKISEEDISRSKMFGGQ